MVVNKRIKGVNGESQGGPPNTGGWESDDVIHAW